MYIIFRKKDGLVIGTAQQIEVDIENNGFVTDGGLVFYAGASELDYREITEELPADVTTGKYLYQIENGLVINPDYVPYVSPEEEVKELKKRLEATEDTLLQLLLMQT